MNISTKNYKLKFFENSFKIKLIFFILIFFIKSQASEVDQFTNRSQNINDSTTIIDKIVISKFIEALEPANSKNFLLSNDCNSTDPIVREETRIKFIDSLKKTFLSKSPFGLLENMIEKNKKLSKDLKSVQYEESVYAKSNNRIIKNFGLGKIIKINNVEIGSDKLGHFFDQGFSIYSSTRNIQSDTEKFNRGVIDSIALENGEFGLDTTGVFSYADLSANYAGHKFWDKVCGIANNETSTEDREHMNKFRCKKDAYFKCENVKDEKGNTKGQWIINPKSNFTFKDYVTDAWDEGINCNLYTEDMAPKVFQKLNNIANTYGGNPNQPCPVDINKCLQLQNNYPDDIARKITSPVCKKFILEKKGRGPKIEKNERFNYSYDFYQKPGALTTPATGSPASTSPSRTKN